MNVAVSRDELAAVASGVVPEHLQAAAGQMLADLADKLTLADLFPVGLSAEELSGEIRNRFEKWQRLGTRCYASEAAAREAKPRCFRSVCSEWGRAGTIHRDYRLKDGRIVRCSGVWWDVPEPGGSEVVFFLI